MSHSTTLSLALHLLTEGICLQAVVAIIASHSASPPTEVLRIQWLSPESSMLGHLGTGRAGIMRGCPGVASRLLQSARIAPHGRRKVPLHPWGLRRATDGRAGPGNAVPKPGEIPKFSLPSWVILPLPPSCSGLHAPGHHRVYSEWTMSPGETFQG